MPETDKDEGILQALLERMNSQRLPRLLALKEKVDAGERLADSDIAYLSEVMEDATQNGPLINRHPEYHELARRIVSLYHEISERALENEQQGG